MPLTVNENRGYESMDWEFYDTVTLATGTNRFFGNTEAASGVSVTNMQSPNILPVGQKFVVHSIGFAGDTDITTANGKALLKDTALKVFINSKLFFNTLVLRLPAAGGLYGADSTASTPIVSNGNPSVASEYRFKRVLTVDSTTPFYVEVVIPVGANALRGRVFLRGLLTRPVG